MGCASNWHVSLPDTVAVITPDPHRGVGRHRGAHIRVQRNPLFGRRAPAPITSTLKGLVMTQKVIRGPFNVVF